MSTGNLNNLVSYIHKRQQLISDAVYELQHTFKHSRHQSEEYTDNQCNSYILKVMDDAIPVNIQINLKMTLK